MLRKRLKCLIDRFDISVRQLYAMYVCIFFLPLLLTLLLTNNAISQLESQVQKTGRTMTHQIQTVIDSRMNDINVILDQINNHATIRYLLNRDDTLTPSDRYKYITIINDLRNQYTNTTLIEDMYIYMANTDSVISTFSRTDSKFFYENYYSYEGMDYETWLNEYMRRPQSMTVLPAQNVYNGVTTKRLITVMEMLPRDSGIYQTGMAVLFIDEDWLLSQIVPDDTYNRSVSVYSANGDLIVSSNSGVGASIKPEDFVYMEGAYTSDVDGQAMHISYVKSSVMDWTYVLAMPKAQFFSQVNDLRSVTITALTIVGILGIVLVALLAYVSSIPATSAIEALSVQQNPNELIDHNYSMSMRDIGTFIRQALDDRSLYQKHLPLLIESYVYKLINGSRDAEYELSLASEVLGFRFPTNQFAVMSFQLGSVDNMHDKLRSLIDSIVKLPDAGMNMYCTFVAHDMVAVLISFWAGITEEYRTLLHRSADRIIRSVNSICGEAVDIGISLVGDDSAEINALYRQSVMCLAGINLLQSGRIIFYADVARVVPPSDYSYTLAVEKNLIAYVCTGDAVRMNRLLDEIFAAHEQEARMIEGMTQCLKYDLIGTLFKCAQDVERDDPNSQAVWKKIQELMTLERPDMIYASMREVFNSLCNRAYSTRSSHNDDMRDSILQYLAENYSNPDMGLDMVARAFGIAPSYLSRFFKEQTGGNFLTHVNRLRVEHAAQLLRNTDMSYAKIAEQCGLSGSQALNRIFNRVLGVSPTMYRQLARQGALDINNELHRSESQ